MRLHISLNVLCGVSIFVTMRVEVQSQPQIISAELGASVTLQCFHLEKQSLLYLYKQPIGMKPQLLVSVPKYGLHEFYGEFKDNPRFKVARNTGVLNLIISNAVPSDTAVYYCTHYHGGILSFGEGILLVLPDAECRNYTVHQKPVSYQGNQGDSAVLQCTVHANVGHNEEHNGEHSVYWFRHGSGESHPGIIYTHGNRSDQCVKSSETGSPTHSCVYKLLKRNLSLSDAGTYYCAVAVCGEILFGNGTNLKVEGHCVENHLIIYSLAAALALCMVLFLSFLVIFFNNRRNMCCQNCREMSWLKSEPSIPETDMQEEREEEPYTLNYAALNTVKKKAGGRRQRKPDETVVIYSSVRCQNQNQLN